MPRLWQTPFVEDSAVELSEPVTHLRDRKLSDEEREALVKARADARDDQIGEVARARARQEGLPQRSEIGQLAVAVVADVAVKILDGKIPVKSALAAKQVGELFYNIARLEAGEATSLVGTVDRQVILDNVKALRDQARRAIKTPE